jgi:predicted MFS family arabinose efflux permease
MLAHLMPPGALRFVPGLPAAVALMTIISMGYFGVDAFVPLALTDIRHRSTSFAGLALTAAALAWTGGAWVQTHVAETRSRRQIIRLGLALIVTATAGMVATLFESVPAVVALLAWGVSGLGMGFAYASVSLTVLQSAEPGKEGAATSGMQIGFVLGTALGAGIGGAWLALLSDGEIANRSALLAQNLLMIGVLLIAFIAARQVPAWPGRPGQ